MSRQATALRLHIRVSKVNKLKTGFSFVVKCVFLLCMATFSYAESQKTTRCPGVQFRVNWSAENIDFIVLISSSLDFELNSCVRHLNVLEAIGINAGNIVYREDMLEMPVAVWPLGDRFLTLWESGSAFWIVVYENKKKVVRKVLDVRYKGVPEIGYSKNGQERLIFSRYGKREDGKDIPILSDVYVWFGSGYRKVENVPWSKRFDEIDVSE